MNASVYEELKKALDIVGTGVSGSVNLIPELLDPEIQELARLNRPLRTNLGRKKPTLASDKWQVNRRLTRGTAQFVDDDDEPSDSNATYGRTPFEFKTILGRGKVSKDLQAKGASYIDVLQEEMESMTDVCADLEEEKLISGSVSADPKEYDGLHILVPASANPQAVDAGGTLVIAKMDEVADVNYSNTADMLIICSQRTQRAINGLKVGAQRYMDKMEVDGGFKVSSWDGVPIFWSQFQPDTEYADGSALTGGTKSSLYLINKSKFFMGLLEELHMEVLAKTSSQFDKFDIVERVVAVLKNRKYVSRLFGIS